MEKEREDKLEQRIRFVSRHYRENAFDEEKAWSAFAEKNSIKKNKTPLFRYRQAVAAVILLCITISTWYFMTNEREEWIVVETASGQMKNVFLPDSSMVSMDENSAIKYNLVSFKKGDRDVEMKGKIFFHVNRKEDSPFSVISRNTVVRVLGTSFQVNEKSHRTELYVNTGKVSFSAKKGDEKLILTAGMSAWYDDDAGAIVQQAEENGNVLSWHTKELHFNNTSLENVIRDLADYYKVEIVNRMNDGDKHLTASFNDLPLEETLLIINQTLDIHLVKVAGQ